MIYGKRCHLLSWSRGWQKNKKGNQKKKKQGWCFGKNIVAWKAKAKGNGERSYEWQIHFQFAMNPELTMDKMRLIAIKKIIIWQP